MSYKYSFFIIISIAFSTFLSTCQTPQKVFIIMGIPGSGKTTTAQKIAQRHPHSVAYFSAGELLRKAAEENSLQGARIAKLLSEGSLVPVEICMPIIEKAFSATKKPIILFDGFFRSIEYAEAFEKLAAQRNFSLEKVISIEVSEQCAIERLKMRARPDDEIAILKRRTELYLKGFGNIAKQYSQKNMFIKINGEQPQEKVVEEIEKVISS